MISLDIEDSKAPNDQISTVLNLEDLVILFIFVSHLAIEVEKNYIEETGYEMIREFKPGLRARNMKPKIFKQLVCSKQVYIGRERGRIAVVRML